MSALYCAQPINSRSNVPSQLVAGMAILRDGGAASCCRINDDCRCIVVVTIVCRTQGFAIALSVERVGNRFSERLKTNITGRRAAQPAAQVCSINHQWTNGNCCDSTSQRPTRTHEHRTHKPCRKVFALRRRLQVPGS